VDKNVVISGRLVHGWGDYDDTTDRPANFPPHDGDWEGIPTTDESYGWNKFDTSHKPPSHFIQLLAKSAARGGNLLLNIGPMGDGNIDPKDVAILQGVGDWWRMNGGSIRGTTRTPLPVQAWGETTRKDNTLYLHVFNWPTNRQLIVGGLKSPATNAGLLAVREISSAVDPGRPNQADILKVIVSAMIQGACRVTRLNPLDVAVTIPTNAIQNADTVVVLECAGDIQADTNRLLQPEFPVETLRAFDGELRGGLKFGPGKKTDDVVMNWTNESQSVTWPVRLEKAVTYEVTVNYTAPEESEGGAFSVDFGSQKLDGTVAAGADKTISLGQVSLAPGKFEISVRATKISGGELFRLRRVELKPVTGR
jgi:hypothetical protein